VTSTVRAATSTAAAWDAAAIQAALDKVSLGLLDGHIRGCVREEIEAGGGDAKVDELLQVMDRVLRR
jgi:DNA-binding FrmR family transcriptional regulator